MEGYERKICFRCEKCGKNNYVDAESIPDVVKCEHCGQAVAVPGIAVSAANLFVLASNPVLEHLSRR